MRVRRQRVQHGGEFHKIRARAHDVKYLHKPASSMVKTLNSGSSAT
jgi:hypothetical protein